MSERALTFEVMKSAADLLILVDQEAARKKAEAFTEAENQAPEEAIKAAAQAAAEAEIVGAADATAAAAGLCTVSPISASFVC